MVDMRFLVISVVMLIRDSGGQSLGRPPLIAVTDNKIYLVDELTWTKHLLYTRQNIKFNSIDFHYEKQMIFAGYSDYEYDYGYSYRGKIMSARLQNGVLTDIKTLLTANANKPRVAVDWINDKLYWKGEAGKIGYDAAVIYTSNLDGSESSLLRNIEWSNRYSNFQVDPINRKYYFLSKTTGWEEILQQGDMDSNRSPLTIDNCTSDGQIILRGFYFAIDHANNGKVYWMDEFSSRLKSLNPDLTSPTSYDFGAYEFPLALSGEKTIDVPFRTAHKVINMKGHIKPGANKGHVCWKCGITYARERSKNMSPKYVSPFGFGSLYGNPWYKSYEKSGVIAQMITGSETINYLPSLGMKYYQVFHSSAQPRPSVNK